MKINEDSCPGKRGKMCEKSVASSQIRARNMLPPAYYNERENSGYCLVGFLVVDERLSSLHDFLQGLLCMFGSACDPCNSLEWMEITC